MEADLLFSEASAASTCGHWQALPGDPFDDAGRPSQARGLGGRRPDSGELSGLVVGRPLEGGPARTDLRVAPGPASDRPPRPSTPPKHAALRLSGSGAWSVPAHCSA
ncbi:uncharacterized protein AAEQ78_001713 isoform 1-T2 [Lycaon pictus]